jgi:dihydroxyacetone kinase-like predicted kinase
MSAQHHRLQGDTPRRPRSLKRLAVVAVASGDGFRRILESIGVDSVVTGGQTMNPSTQDLLSAVESAPANDVLLLPNNGNVVLAAQQVSQLTRKRLRVVPSRSLPQGIAALFAFDFEGSLEENAASMTKALAQVATIEVTTAVRDSKVGDVAISEGQMIGLLNDRLVATGDTAEEVVGKVLEQVRLTQPQTVTIYSGAGAKAGEADALTQLFKRCYPEVTVESQDGGQDLYPFVIALE